MKLLSTRIASDECARLLGVASLPARHRRRAQQRVRASQEHPRAVRQQPCEQHRAKGSGLGRIAQIDANGRQADGDGHELQHQRGAHASRHAERTRRVGPLEAQRDEGGEEEKVAEAVEHHLDLDQRLVRREHQHADGRR
eukprot:740405-Prymnesium_polylepis.1